TRSVAGVSSILSSRLVCSISASSPRLRTSSMIAAAAASTSAASSRLAARNFAKAAAKSFALLSSSSGIGRLAETLDPAIHLRRTRLQRGTIDDEARGDVGDMLDLDQAVDAQRAAGRDEIDDLPREPHARGQLHRAVQDDAFGLDAALREMPPRHLGIFGRD